MKKLHSIRVLMEWSPGSAWQCDVEGHMLFAELAEHLCDQVYSYLLSVHGDDVVVFYDYTLEALQQAADEDWADPSIRGIIEQCPFCIRDGDNEDHAN